MNPTLRLALTTGTTLALLGSAHAAVPFTLNFDNQPAGSDANPFAPAGLSIAYGVFVPDFDAFGDPILGTEHWEPDPTAPPVSVDNPNTFGRGSAPSPANALNALLQPVLFSFSSPVTIDNFRTVLDNDPFGDSAATIDFFGATRNLLRSVPANQTQPGLVVNSGPIPGGVSTIVLAGGAFYDNIAAVPEPGTIGFGLALAAACLAMRGPRGGRRA